ncbi:MAG: HAD family hydrolase, partial [Deltaproteobacteria bacterium]
MQELGHADRGADLRQELEAAPELPRRRIGDVGIVGIATGMVGGVVDVMERDDAHDRQRREPPQLHHATEHAGAIERVDQTLALTERRLAQCHHEDSPIDHCKQSTCPRQEQTCGCITSNAFGRLQCGVQGFWQCRSARPARPVAPIAALAGFVGADRVDSEPAAALRGTAYETATGMATLVRTPGVAENRPRMSEIERGPAVALTPPPLSPGATGLSSAEAARRLGEVGALMLGAALISGILREVADAIAIAAIVVLNAVVGFLQEYRAERAVLALRSMTAPRARVLRDGRAATVAAREVVPGDVLLLEAGDIVAADAALVEAHALRASEAALTGESTPVDKLATPASADAALAERHDRVFLGTSIAAGTGRAVVTATGMATELGRIARLLETAEDEPTPLQRRLAQVSRMLLYATVAIVAVVAAAGLVRGAAAFDVFLSAVSLAVAAVPEGLPAIVTIALAIGVHRMVVRNALVRKLPAVETLGCATVICTDKTGTLTTGAMAVRELWGPDHEALLDAAAACCDAELGADLRGGIGDPTELAILAEAALRDIQRDAIERERPRALVEPFDPATKRMAIRRGDGIWYVKGALEAVAPSCTAGLTGAHEAAIQLAARGLRVLAVAVGDAPDALVLRGLIGVADPPRPEAIEAVAAARAAGIRTVMITGDHPATAQVIARELGILRPG